MKEKYICEQCGRKFYRYPCQQKESSTISAVSCVWLSSERVEAIPKSSTRI